MMLLYYCFVSLDALSLRSSYGRESHKFDFAKAYTSLLEITGVTS